MSLINALPKFIVLKMQRNMQYLIHLTNDKDRLQFSGTDFASLHAKFEVVPSSTVHGLVHIKSCYNNMYWVCRPNDNLCIAAAAREMEEDQTKVSCTLFKPIFFTSNRIGLCHAHIKKNVRFEDPRPHYAYVGDAKDEGDYLDFFDWDSLPILPQYIALKGYNKMYLKTYKKKYSKTLEIFHHLPGIREAFDDGLYLRLYGEDKGDQEVGMEVFTTPDHNIRLKSKHYGKFWSAKHSWVWPEAQGDTNHDPYTVFQVIKRSHDKIALKCMGNDRFCMSISADFKKDCLNACSTTVPESATFQFEELADKIKIFNVSFYEMYATTYEKNIFHEVKSTDFNDSQVAQQSTLEFEYTEEESQTWTTTNSSGHSVETEITVSLPTKVGIEGRFQYAYETTTTVTEGKTLARKDVKKYTTTVSVPPMSKVVATFLVAQTLCDIPYSYNKTVNFTDGKSVTHHMDDGLYTYLRTEVSIHTVQEKISS